MPPSGAESPLTMQPLQTSVEENLAALLFCTRMPVDGDTQKRIVALSRSKPDWEGLLAAANQHSLTPIFCKNLEAYAGEALPASWRQRLGDEFLRNSCRNLALTAELLRLLETLESLGVSATPHKGPVLAAQACGDVALRQFSDLDIIVPQGQIAAAHHALLGLGFRALIPDLIQSREHPENAGQIPGQYAYHKEPETLVELHTERTLRYFPRRLNLGKLCERREYVSVGGRQVLAFSREDTLLLISVHGSKHFWERLGWIADVAALASASPRLDWALALDRARRWGIDRMVLLGAGLAAQLYDSPLPEEATDSLKRDGMARRLIKGICYRLFAAEREQLGVFSRFAFRVRMRGSALEGVPYAVRLALMPTELDRGRHANYLEPVYALLRPMRLARTYGWRTRAGR